MAYIIVLNPIILGFGHGHGRRRSSAASRQTSRPSRPRTALVAGVMTILMGVVANFPLALATGSA